MTTNQMTHERFETLLPDWMEGELRGDEREAFAAHAAECAQCGALVRDLEQIVARAGSLGPIEPPRELWEGIEARIGATVLPLTSRRRTIPLLRGLIAASVLVAATAGITWKLAQRDLPEGVAVATPAQPQSQPQPQSRVAAAGNTGDQNPSGGPVIGGPVQVASANTGSEGGPKGPVVGPTPQHSSVPEPGATLVSNGKSGLKRMPGESDVYDREITRLRIVLRSRRNELDPRTVLTIEKSLAVIDTAIAQARSALAADPASRFLNDQLTNALDKKVELLRTAALLPARS